jgi:hypothetical protein
MDFDSGWLWLRRIAPHLLLLAVNPVFHRDLSLVRRVSFLIELHAVNQVLDASVVRPGGRKAVTLADFLRLQFDAVHAHIQSVVRLHVERRPTEVTGVGRSRGGDERELRDDKRNRDRKWNSRFQGGNLCLLVASEQQPRQEAFCREVPATHSFRGLALRRKIRAFLERGTLNPFSESRAFFSTQILQTRVSSTHREHKNSNIRVFQIRLQKLHYNAVVTKGYVFLCIIMQFWALCPMWNDWAFKNGLFVSPQTRSCNHNPSKQSH